MKDLLKESMGNFEGKMKIELKDGVGEVSVKVESGGICCLSAMVSEILIAFYEWLEQNTEYTEEEIKGKFHELVDITIDLKEIRRKMEVLNDLETKVKLMMAKKETMNPEEFAETTDAFIKMLETVRDMAKEDAKNGR